MKFTLRMQRLLVCVIFTHTIAYINVLEKNKNEKDKELIRENLLNEEDMIKS